MGWKGLERNRLDYILTDLLPVEISELFSFSQLYTYLLKKEKQKTIDKLISEMKKTKAEGSKAMFQRGWSSKPLKYKILKGNGTMREMSVIQPFSAINIFLFIECYQKEILNYFEKYNCFSIRYHAKNSNLYYKSKSGKQTYYFQDEESRMGRGAIQQSANFFKIKPFEAINAFTDSREWRMSNFKYKHYAKLDYKSCFDSIYTHTFSWLIERNSVDAKDANNSHLFITIDRILQNINGKSSNGIVVGPEFSRMIAEILLQHIDYEVLLELGNEGIFHKKDYMIYRYVDDIFVFAHHLQTIEKIIAKYKDVGNRYLLHINELKLTQGTTPCLPKEWLEKTRQLSDIIGGFFYQGKKSDYDKLPEDKQYIIKSDFISVDRLKDEIAVLIKRYPDDNRTIVSFLLSTLLNNVSKKKNGYKLFGGKPLGKSLLLLDITFYIYAFYPSFDQTRKVISIISYFNSEINYKTEEKARERLRNLIIRYSFIFQSGNIFDLCDWFPFFCEYRIELDTETEKILKDRVKNYKDPIIMANYLLYSRYFESYRKKVLKDIESIIRININKISENQPMMQEEIWYILVFHNCPYISKELQDEMCKLISKMKPKTTGSKCKPSDVIINLICEFLEQRSKKGNKPKESFFNWKGINNFSDQITYRTYQRTIFKRYSKNSYYLYTSID